MTVTSREATASIETVTSRETTAGAVSITEAERLQQVLWPWLKQKHY